MIQDEVVFPLTVFFENGETEAYEDVEDLELNLEDFDSDTDTACGVRDNLGRKVRLKIHLLSLETLEVADKRPKS